jgi:hypothetical protein
VYIISLQSIGQPARLTAADATAITGPGMASGIALTKSSGLAEHRAQVLEIDAARRQGLRSRRRPGRNTSSNGIPAISAARIVGDHTDWLIPGVR